MSGERARGRPTGRRGRPVADVDGLWVSCLHEAGHAVMAQVVGFEILEVRTRGTRYLVPAERDRRYRRARLLVLLGGEAAVDLWAEAEHPGEWVLNGGERDERRAWRQARRLGYTGKRAQRLLLEAYATARAELARRWPRVLALAERVYREGVVAAEALGAEADGP